ncbi:5-methylcytosine-specific restriction enzyme subunit McrC [Salinivirga cyanobacteriivorans]|uniref:5-methylcytosine-specific restriction enzyme subunit McrC n=1 Tax=Salinivirga cyanobacteriivorans TaxID=1307839 RepID=A0A0S2I3L0_9BACT|nr:restriction endonuclease [Salinivirga cyanobacteriivorans]ALO16823.1 5-methylcytosine-specific restriction enzyme subunit McrC [Salinivirga cyanobacteriivorans]
MKAKREHIRVFEHQTIELNQQFEGGIVFDQTKLDAFVRFFGKGIPYYSLIRNGIQFNEYVGAIQIGNTLVSVLPKVDRSQIEEKAEIKKWNQVLIDMLRVVNGFDVKAPSSSQLKVKNNSVLDLYFELFVVEVEYLIHRGLVKKYRKTEGNLNALKGSIQFNKQLGKNAVHKERFYTRHSTYDTEHVLHIILSQTIQLLKRVNTNSTLVGRINALILNFPEMPNQKITQSVFDKVAFNRKTMGYKKAIEIARLILLHYHPDLSKGRDDVLALMFNMNALWEQFVLVSLRKSKEFKVRGQDSRYFWKPESGKRRSIRPDITVSTKDDNYVLDTKWKLVASKPSVEDVRQMYAYHHYFEAKKVALLYPGDYPYIKGKFIDIKYQNQLSELECGLLFTKYNDSVKNWQKSIGEEIKHWINSPSIESHN